MKHLNFLLLAPLIILSSMTLTFTEELRAEPWTSNRYAQNCAACHAPGRFNLPAKGRRCTLTCQGCHVNPNGGGLRNEYGVWTQQRWLRSFPSKALMGSKKTPAPDFYQPYVKSKAKRRGKRRKHAIRASRKVRWKKLKKGQIPKMAVLNGVTYKEEDYDYYVYRDWDVEAKSMAQFLSRVPKDDPWRLERKKMLLAGGDIRYFYGNIDVDADGSKSKRDMSAIMAVDLGVRYRPIREHLQFVFESRYGNSPQNTELEQGFTEIAQIRSAYAFVDQLAYNTWFMAGLYRPHFGHYNPDHKALSQELSGLNQWATYKSFGVGTAPNVPFINVHYIQPAASSGFPQEDGFNVNVGARFVTKSASAKLSYWNTENKGDGSKKEMYSLSAGGMLWTKLILNYEMLRVSKELANGQLDAGNVNTVELKYRLWRENYAMFNYAFSNVAKDLTTGNASEIMTGFKSFIWSGVEVELLYILRNERVSNADQKQNIAQLQLHYFF